MAIIAWALANPRAVALAVLLAVLAWCGVALYSSGKHAAQQQVIHAAQTQQIKELQEAQAELQQINHKTMQILSAREADYAQIQTSYDSLHAKFGSMRVTARCVQAGDARPSTPGTAQSETGQWSGTREYDLADTAEQVLKLGRDYDQCVSDFNTLSARISVK